MKDSALELSAPPALAKNGVRVVALGGLGEVGRNMTVVEHQGRLLIVDCGVLFPEDHPGVDLILPDFEYLKDRLDDIEAIVLTHGHEDHIGAVPYLLRLRKDIPLIGSTLTLALIEAKLEEHRIKPVLKPVKEGDIEEFGPFECEFVAVNHSIPDALAVAVHTDAGTILHTGDFKMDQLPLDGRITDLRSFARLGEEGKDVDVYVVGRKAQTYFDFRGRGYKQLWTGQTDAPVAERATEIGEVLVDAFLTDTADGGVDEIHVVFTEFVSLVKQNPHVVRLLPLEVVEEEAATAEDVLPLYEYEPDAEEVLDALLPKYIESRIFNAMLQSAASELANRQRAMKSAGDNATSLIKDYTLLMNNARQAEITQELTELIAGADALNNS